MFIFFQKKKGKKEMTAEEIKKLIKELPEDEREKLKDDLFKAEDEREIDKIEKDKADTAEEADEKKEEIKEESEEIGKDIDEIEKNDKDVESEEDKEGSNDNDAHTGLEKLINAAVEKAVTAKIDEMLNAEKSKKPTPVTRDEEEKLSDVESIYN